VGFFVLPTPFFKIIFMFSIGIPTLNRADLLLPSIEKYLVDFKNTEIHIIDNGNQKLTYLEENENIYVHNQQENIGVAASWNKLCDIIFQKQDWALLVNDDVYLGYGRSNVYWCMEMSEVGISQSEFNWSVLLINKDLYEFIGRFDEGFYPAYFEDSDYMYRLKLKGLLHEVNSKLNPKEVKVSQTYEKAPDLVNLAMKLNRQRYIDKWGNVPLLEIFKTPFNNNLL
jgi:glycosyltransferase involved in cell wall biosynthesis